MTIVIQTKWMKLDNVDDIKIYLGMPSHSTPFSWRSYDGYTFTNSYPSFQHQYNHHPSFFFFFFFKLKQNQYEINNNVPTTTSSKCPKHQS
jgi:hypothetical protein